MIIKCKLQLCALLEHPIRAFRIEKLDIKINVNVFLISNIRKIKISS